MGKKKVDVKFVYLLIVIVLILTAAVVYLTFGKPAETPAVASEEQATEVQQDLSTSISDIKDDLEQLKKSLGK